MEKKTIGTFIAILRKGNGMTQRELADKLGVSDKTVSHWERDESAPDLTLIPVIAEVFGVTCDELLRGEKLGANAPEERASAKAEKQVKHLLNLSRTRLKTRSMISVGLSVAGLLAAMICNFSFLRATLGFLLGCIFYAAAIICESVFCTMAFSAVGGEDFEGDALNDYKMHAARLTQRVICLPMILLGACLPLALIPSDIFQGMNAGTWLGITAGTWLEYGLLGAGVASVICLIATLFIDNALIKKGVYTPDEKQRSNIKLKVRYTGIFAAILLVTLLGQMVFYSAAGPEGFSKGTVFDNYVDFKEYIGTEKGGVDEQVAVQEGDIFQSDNLISYFDKNGNAIMQDEAQIGYIYDASGDVACKYIHRNQEVVMISYNSGGLPVTTYTPAQLEAGNSVMNSINIAWVVLYFIETGIGFLIYFKKRAK